MTKQSFQKPDICVIKTDADLLWMLANASSESNDLADVLAGELERAKIVPDTKDDGFIRIGSSAAYRTENQGERSVTLVLPKDADIARGRISVMTPVGVALLGLSAGQSIQWQTRDGRTETLTVVSVNPPSPFDNTDGAKMQQDSK